MLPHLSEATPTPLQVHAEKMDLPIGPQLHIFEDGTGSGKTEAATLCAYRLIQAELAEGIFVALPTMATANAMYVRMAEVYHNIFAKGSRPSLVLAHGSRHLSQRFLKSINLEDIPHKNYFKEESAEASCSAWLADNRKKAMLAATGIGTIDQALLAILTSKHQSLRLFGLGRNVMIVDEVHSYDPYMHRLLCTLLTFQAAQGGSAILLSATLPVKTKNDLARAFAEGLSYQATELKNLDYPLETTIAREVSRETPLRYRDGRYHVPVKLLHETKEVEEKIALALAAGGCVLWVRNTVGDALEARSTIIEKDIVKPENIILFHARFAASDRLKIEEKILSIFGVKGCANGRKGKIVVSTQVAEQSLDVDFDVLITDLAPIDLVLQRIGRWRRHKREDRPSGLPDSVYVYSPSIKTEPDASWYPSVFSRGAYVYPFQSQLWLTAKLLENGGYYMPEDARRLIEGVYGETSERNVPEALREADFKAQGDAMAEMTMAGINSLNLDQGYGGEFISWKDDEVSPTRLGDPTVRLRLAKWDGQYLTPWSDDSPPSIAWSLSEVSVSAWLVTENTDTANPELAKSIEKAIETMPDKCKWSILIPLTLSDSDTWKACVQSTKGYKTILTYSAEFGLSHEKA